MYILFIPAALALLLALAMNLVPLFDFKRPRPMLEQIEDEMQLRANLPPEHHNCRCAVYPMMIGE